jgi:hypothetical protein
VTRPRPPPSSWSGIGQAGCRRDLALGWLALLVAFSASIVQTPLLLGVAASARPLDAPAEVKALLVAPVSVLVAFVLATCSGESAPWHASCDPQPGGTQGLRVLRPWPEARRGVTITS